MLQNLFSESKCVTSQPMRQLTSHQFWVENDARRQEVFDGTPCFAPAVLFHTERQPSTLMRISFAATQEAGFEGCLRGCRGGRGGDVMAWSDLIRTDSGWEWLGVGIQSHWPIRFHVSSSAVGQPSAPPQRLISRRRLRYRFRWRHKSSGRRGAWQVAEVVPGGGGDDEVGLPQFVAGGVAGLAALRCEPGARVG